MIRGIGTDILRVERMARLLARHPERAPEKLLTADECKELARAGNPANRLAKSFAAKEAFAKAWGTGFAGLGYHDVAVRRDAAGKPWLAFSAAMQARLDAAGVTAAHLSLSDDDGWVLAFVVLEGRDDVSPS